MTPTRKKASTARELIAKADIRCVDRLDLNADSLSRFISLEL
jgi:hypothetical protein